jgi:hypothetical protein
VIKKRTLAELSPASGRELKKADRSGSCSFSHLREKVGMRVFFFS